MPSNTSIPPMRAYSWPTTTSTGGFPCGTLYMVVQSGLLKRAIKLDHHRLSLLISCLFLRGHTSNSILEHTPVLELFIRVSGFGILLATQTPLSCWLGSDKASGKWELVTILRFQAWLERQEGPTNCRLESFLIAQIGPISTIVPECSSKSVKI